MDWLEESIERTRYRIFEFTLVRPRAGGDSIDERSLKDVLGDMLDNQIMLHRRIAELELHDQHPDWRERDI